MDKWSNGEVFNLKTIYDVMFNIGFLFIIIGGVGEKLIFLILISFIVKLGDTKVFRKKSIKSRVL